MVFQFAPIGKPRGLVARSGRRRYILVVQFIVPAQPKLRTSPPFGDAWIHEVKFDGWWIQVHKYLDTVAPFTKGGDHVGRMFPALVEAVAQLPIRSFNIGGESHGLRRPRRT
jgi:bifunctional non-homologous end joining protein LigD